MYLEEKNVITIMNVKNKLINEWCAQQMLLHLKIYCACNSHLERLIEFND